MRVEEHDTVSVVSRIIGRVSLAARRLGRATTKRSHEPRSAPRSYPRDFHVMPRAADRVGDWPVPPAVDGPAASLEPTGVESPPMRYDLVLFEALNAEYAGTPIVRESPQYDMASVVARSQRRLVSIHRRVDLMSKTVLEVGCGSGLEVWHLAHGFNCDAWGVDILPRRAWPTLESERVHLLAGDISDQTLLQEASFDRVISNTVWEHLEHPRAALAETFRTLKPGGLAWIRANLYRGPTASHRARDIHFPFPHLLFADEVIAEALGRAGVSPRGAAWVNRLTWEQYEVAMLEVGFRIRSLRFDEYPLDERFYDRFRDILGRYPRRDLERGFFTVILEKPRT